MKRLSQIVALLTLLLTCAAPVMACMVPDAAMSAEERACCRMMQGQCGQMGMPASHDCCHKAPSVAQTAVLTAQPTVLEPPVTVAASMLEMLWTPDVWTGPWPTAPNASPPRRPRAALSQLRV